MVDLRGRLKIVVPNFSTNPSANTTLTNPSATLVYLFNLLAVYVAREERLQLAKHPLNTTTLTLASASAIGILFGLVVTSPNLLRVNRPGFLFQSNKIC